MRSKIVSKEVLGIYDLIVSSGNFVVSSYDDGMLEYIYQVRNNKMNGYCITVKSDQILVTQKVMFYENGVPNGMYYIYNFDMLVEVGEYVNGAKCDDVCSYSRRKVTGIEIYNNGVLVKSKY